VNESAYPLEVGCWKRNIQSKFGEKENAKIQLKIIKDKAIF